jgi:hypothetical protein
MVQNGIIREWTLRVPNTLVRSRVMPVSASLLEGVYDIA